jgi:type IV pilus assembly protein PilM
LGLDIGTSAIKFVQLKNAGKLTKLIGHGRFNVPKNYIIEGIVTEPEKLAKELKEIFKKPPWGKITAKRLIASLPESHLFTRVLDLPKIKEKDLEEAIKYEVDQSIPAAATDLYVDWEIIKETNDKTTIFLAAAPKSIVDSYVQLSKELEMEPLALEISLSAIARAMISNKDNVEPVIILDLGGQTSNMGVFDTSLRVTGSHPIGGTTAKNLLISNLGLSEKEAENAIRTAFQKDDKTSQAVKDEFERLAIEVVKLKDYFLENNPNAKINKILLCGGVAYLEGLTDFFNRKTALEAKVGNPWVNISIYPLKPVAKDESPSYATAIGLCLRGFQDE